MNVVYFREPDSPCVIFPPLPAVRLPLANKATIADSIARLAQD